MTNQQILKKAIEKAVENGFPYPNLKNLEEGKTLPKDYFRNTCLAIYENYKKRPLKLIFSHPFAKAFWGEEKRVKDTPFYTTKIDNKTGEPCYGWQYHLQQMVLEKDPLKYLAKFL